MRDRFFPKDKTDKKDKNHMGVDKTKLKIKKQSSEKSAETNKFVIYSITNLCDERHKAMNFTLMKLCEESHKRLLQKQQEQQINEVENTMASLKL